MNHKTTINMNEFLDAWRKYEAIGAPDPILSAAAEIMHVNRVTMSTHARQQLVDLVAFYKGNAKPGMVAKALMQHNERVRQFNKDRQQYADLLSATPIGGMQ